MKRAIRHRDGKGQASPRRDWAAGDAPERRKKYIIAQAVRLARADLHSEYSYCSAACDITTPTPHLVAAGRRDMRLVEHSHAIFAGASLSTPLP